jgi:hypothetical protein
LLIYRYEVQHDRSSQGRQTDKEIYARNGEKIQRTMANVNGMHKLSFKTTASVKLGFVATNVKLGVLVQS